MKLRELLCGIEVLEVHADLETEISGVSYDSRQTKSGDLFAAIAGYETDGHRFIPMALEKGAACVLCQARPEGEVPYVLASDSRAALAQLGRNWFGDPAASMTMVGVTGTNGKTTTTTLTGEILKAHLGQEKVFVVGNIGRPYTMECQKTTPETVTVEELSSFQLETVEEFHPAVSAILNITPDHLNRHHTMEAYVAAKERIAARQTRDDLCVLNFENTYTRDFGARCPARTVYFSSVRPLEEGYWLRGSTIIKSEGGRDQELLDIHRDMRLVGLCNVENVMAAIAIAQGMGVPMDCILSVIRDFRAVEHRIEYVDCVAGVEYYNDSKATNPDAAIQGIRAMSRPTVLIGGGYDKENTYDEWIESFGGRVKCLVLIGQTREKIAECARKHGFDRIRFADTFQECLELCTELAREGDAVLLSPACASWGMFSDYEARGRQFKEYVGRLAGSLDGCSHR